MQSQDILNEKSLEIILNFKPSDKYDKSAVNEILKLKGNIKKITAVGFFTGGNQDFVPYLIDYR